MESAQGPKGREVPLGPTHGLTKPTAMTRERLIVDLIHSNSTGILLGTASEKATRLADLVFLAAIHLQGLVVACSCSLELNALECQVDSKDFMSMPCE